jgi:predicted MPP superfamily phosphohydrolase
VTDVAHSQRPADLRRALVIAPVALLFMAVLFGGHWYVARRLIVQPQLPEVLSTTLLWGIGLLCASLVAQPISERFLSRSKWQWLAWVASIWMGFAFLFLMLLFASDVVVWFGGSLLGALSEGDHNLSLVRARAGLVVLVGLVAGGFALRNGLSPPALLRVEVALPRWPEALDGFRIAQISDIHIGSILGREFAQQLTDRVNALEADLVAVTGDLVDGRVEILRDEVAPFGGLRGRHGVFFVTGNHDHYSGADAWATCAAELGMRVMRNRHIVLGQGEQAFALAGVDDHRAGMLPGEDGEDLDAALAGIPKDMPVVLLAHDPSTFKRASSRAIDLQLSGHTHGGQIWPFRYFVRAAMPFVDGLYSRKGARLYVSRGTGFWGPPMRLAAPAEITELVLRCER